MNKKEKQNSVTNVPKIYAVALILAMAVCLCLLVITAALITYAGVPKELVQLAVLISVGVASLFGSIITSARIGSKGLVFGTLFGILFFLIMYIIGVICFDAQTMLQISLLRMTVVVFMGAVGGVVGVNRKRRRI